MKKLRFWLCLQLYIYIFIAKIHVKATNPDIVQLRFLPWNTRWHWCWGFLHKIAKYQTQNAPDPISCSFVSSQAAVLRRHLMENLQSCYTVAHAPLAHLCSARIECLRSCRQDLRLCVYHAYPRKHHCCWRAPVEFCWLKSSSVGNRHCCKYATLCSN